MQRKRNHPRAPWPVKLLPLLLILGACATGSIREKVLTVPVIEGATYVGQETCEGCHEEMAAAFAENVHGRLATFELMGAEGGCESCHGPGSLHADSQDYDKILAFGALSADEGSALCVKCHDDGRLFDWTHGEHALSDVGCSDCHDIHAGTKTASLKKSDPELCYQCHQEQQAQAALPSHHPVKEGKMACSDCHNPHGELVTAETQNDLCYSCHSRYQGPFVFEHAPAQEDCSYCHDPHGTVANNLLQQNEPFLCLQCHESHFHAAREAGSVGTKATAAFDGEALARLAIDNPTLYTEIVNGNLTPAQAKAQDPSVAITFQNSHGPDGWRQAFLTKCTVCHSVVHGSDLPSQTVPVKDVNGKEYQRGGFGLTR